ncbi:MAG: helix-turn-helix transcriptional regulator, partial [Bacteroidota bacterium]
TNSQIQGGFDLFPPTPTKCIVTFLTPVNEIHVDNGVFKGHPPVSYISPHENHASHIWVNGPFEMFTVVFQIGEFSSLFPFPLHDLEDILIPIYDLGDSALCVFIEQIQSAPSHEARIRHCDDYFLTLLREQGPLERRTQMVVSQILNSSIISLDQTLENFDLSKRHFRRIFTREMGTSPKRFQRSIRIARALFLIKHQPQMNLMEISYRCGYFDHSHFLLDFKKVMSISPSLFRKGLLQTYQEVIYQGEELRN